MAAESFTQVAALAPVTSRAPISMGPPATSSSGGVPVTTAIVTPSGKSTKTAQSVPVILPAATSLNGQSVPSQITIPVTGNRFYVLAASAPVSLTPFRAGAAGTQNLFGIGQGRDVGDEFEAIIAANYNLFPVVALVWVGFDAFINNQLILATNAYSQVAYPTYDVPLSAAVVNIVDLAGQTFMDINGVKWGAISRIAILIFNLDTGDTWRLQAFGATTGTGPQIASIPPAPLPLQLQFTGNYTINNGGAPINMVVSEIYYAIPLQGQI